MLRALALRWSAATLLLFVTGLPFPRALLPDPGTRLSPLTAAAAGWAAWAVGGASAATPLPLRSDSPGLYAYGLFAVVAGGLIGLAWMAARPLRDVAQARVVLTMTVRFVLAHFLLVYGASKLFKVQFYLPEPNTLYTNLGDLTPDLLYWSTMGISRPYSIFLGLAEVLPAFLLLHRRTARAGAWAAAAVMANVVAVNFCYDISVKLLSAFLFLLAVGLVVLLRHPPEPLPRRGRWVSIAVAGWILLDAFWPYLRSGNFNDDAAPRLPLHGGYAVAADSTVPAGTLSRLFIHREGYLILQYGRDSTRDFVLWTDTAACLLYLSGYDGERLGTIHYSREGNEVLLLTGIVGSDTLVIRYTRMPLQSLPLLQPQFHWTDEP